MPEVAQTPHHTLAILSLSDEVHLQILSIPGLAGIHAGCGTLLLLMLVVRPVSHLLAEPLILEGVQCVGRLSVVDDH